MGTILTDKEVKVISSFVHLNVRRKRDDRERDEAAGANFLNGFYL